MVYAQISPGGEHLVNKVYIKDMATQLTEERGGGGRGEEGDCSRGRDCMSALQLQSWTIQFESLPTPVNCPLSTCVSP